MNPNTPLSPAELLPVEREELRPALSARYPNAKGVLGSQLGAFIRRHLKNPDLRERFGGLKAFVGHYFPAEIVWSGRKGLDDVYDISFSADDAGSIAAWHSVACEASTALWSAVTNPSVFVQFAWSPTDEMLLQASAGTPLVEGLMAIEKLTRADYQNIATRFISTLDGLDVATRAHVAESTGSSVEFTRLIRELGLLAKWEEFRVEHALTLFKHRLEETGAESAVVSRWVDVLRSSQQQAWAQRAQKQSTSSQRHRSPRISYEGYILDEIPGSRALAIRALEFLSESEISALSLPLGSVIRALESLLKH